MKSHFNDPYEDNGGNRCCRMILVNILKHYFTDVWMLQVICNYKFDKITFINDDGALPATSNWLDVLNDDKVNRIGGWELWKLKRKYMKLINNRCVNSIYEGKHQMLGNMTCTVNDIIDNEVFIMLYYSVDDSLRNEGLITLYYPYMSGMCLTL